MSTFYTLGAGGKPDLPNHREVTTPEALELAEYYVLISDLESALHNLNAMSAMTFDEKDPASVRAVGEALYRDTLTLIAGCLGSKRLPAAEVLHGIPGGLEMYQYIKDLRDTFAAHNIGPQRQCAMVLERRPGAIALTDLRFRLSLPSKASLDEYIRLVILTIKFAEPKMRDLYAAVRAQVAAMTLAEYEALPKVHVRVPAQAEFRLSRHGFRTGGKGRPRGRGG